MSKNIKKLVVLIIFQSFMLRRVHLQSASANASSRGRARSNGITLRCRLSPRA